MNNILKVVLIVFSIIIFNAPLFAQDIEANLATDDSTSAFTVIDSDGKTILTAMGSGSVGIGSRNSFNLFEVTSRLSFEEQYGRSIFLKAEDDEALGKGGDIFLRCGNGLVDAQDYTNGAKIDLFGASAEPFGVGGKIDIIAGGAYDVGGDINIKAGQGEDAGDINIISGYGRDMGGNVAGTILLQTGPDGWTHNFGDIILNSSGDITLTPEYDSESGGKVVVNGSGTYTGTWTQASDERFKKNIEDLQEPIENLLQLRPVEYEMRVEEFPEKHFEAGKQIGLIAQDVEKLFPQLVKTDKEGYKSVDYSKVSVIAIEAVKNQQKKITSLEKRIENLESLILNQSKMTGQVNLK